MRIVRQLPQPLSLSVLSTDESTLLAKAIWFEKRAGLENFWQVVVPGLPTFVISRAPAGPELEEATVEAILLALAESRSRQREQEQL